MALVLNKCVPILDMFDPNPVGKCSNFNLNDSPTLNGRFGHLKMGERPKNGQNEVFRISFDLVDRFR